MASLAKLCDFRDLSRWSRAADTSADPRRACASVFGGTPRARAAVRFAAADGTTKSSALSKPSWMSWAVEGSPRGRAMVAEAAMDPSHSTALRGCAKIRALVPSWWKMLVIDVSRRAVLCSPVVIRNNVHLSCNNLGPDWAFASRPFFPRVILQIKQSDTPK
jgi:hypothetical protein